MLVEILVGRGVLEFTYGSRALQCNQGRRTQPTCNSVLPAAPQRTHHVDGRL